MQQGVSERTWLRPGGPIVKVVIAVGVVAAVLAAYELYLTMQPGYHDIDALAGAIEDAGYDCDLGDSSDHDFRGRPTVTMAYCNLYRDGRRLEGHGLLLRVIDNSSYMDEYLRAERRAQVTTLPAIVGDNWAMSGSIASLPHMSSTLLRSLEGARRSEI